MRSVTKAEFARERGVHPSRVSQWLRDGRIAELDDGKIDAEAAHARLGATLDQSKGARRDGNVTSISPAQGSQGKPDDLLQEGSGAAPSSTTRDSTDYWEHKARREKAEASISEMKAMQAAGELVSAAGVKREFTEIARTTRNAMLAIVDRVAPVLDPSNPARAHKLLTEEIGRALRELSAHLEQRAAVDDRAREGEPTLQ